MSETPSTLAQLQAWFFAALVEPEQTSAETCAELLSDSASLSARARLGVYQRSYILRLQKCLAEQFPALCHALGEGLFIDFAREYLRAHPSTSHSLYDLGDGFPDWLEANRPDRDEPDDQRESWIDFMVDLARYEHALFRLFDAPGHEGQPWPTPAVDDDDLVLQPCFDLVASRYPVASYYHEVSQGRAPELPPREDAWVAIVRRDYLTRSFPITAVHHRFLSTVRCTGAISTALTELAETSGQPLPRVRQSWTERVRHAWLAAGFFVTRAAA
jgi:hypothetical protein